MHNLPVPTTCPLCNGEVICRYKQFPGYKEGQSFDIFECLQCQVSFVFPLTTNSEIYESIYNHADVLIGYERYYRYGKLTKHFSNPLLFLQNTEPSYWAVLSEIVKDARSTGEITILEIGSGLGYTTYVLRNAGYKAEGIDISSVAVAHAKKIYGDYFSTASIADIKNTGKRYDYILLMDVIEHVTDPVTLIQEASGLLSSNGKLLVTTPNKSSAPADVSLWQSDAPPVHLWFFAEESLRFMAKQLHLNYSFVDLTCYTKKFSVTQFSSSIESLRSTLPRLLKNGDVSMHGKVSVTPDYLLKARYIFAYIRKRLRKKSISKRTPIVCAIFSID